MKRLWSLALVACCSLLLNACFEPEEDYSGDNNGANNGGENNGGNNGGENNGANNGNNGNNGGNNGEGQICGTRGAAPCAEGEFCSWSEAAMCGASDLPGTCQPIPEACDQVYEPVCGCDGQTYGNACEANAAGVSFASKGECDVIEPPDGVRCGARAGDTCGPDEFCDYQEGEYCGAADAEATCQPRPEACPQVYAPVCGCDGQTYGNDCEANGNGVGVLHSGECGDQPPEEIFCGGFGAVECPEGQFCFYDADAICGADDGGGVCRPTPEVCPDIYAPVCGCDGQVYGNECEANGAGTSAAPSDWCDMPPVGVSCGARAGDTCGRDEFCDYREGQYCGQADAQATCQPRPEACPQVYAPVCGCDGRTYGNDCEANANGVGVFQRGECGAEPPEEVVCGGLLGAQCPRGQFCAYEVDAICGAADATGLCRPTPEVCPEIFAPVCGCDDQTYSSPCHANAAGVSVASRGRCDEPPVEGCLVNEDCGRGEYCRREGRDACGLFLETPGQCAPRPEFCTEEYAPVCGCDGETYSNACHAAGAGTNVAGRGECGPQEQSCGGFLGTQCGRGQFCEYAEEDICGAADATGVCREIPQLCTQEYAPVCGCDGQTYSNACHANAAGTSVSSQGECGVIERFCGGFAGFQCERGEFCDYALGDGCGVADGGGLCREIPQICTQEVDPVCGCDGETYSNECAAHAAGVSVDYRGRCRR